MFRSSSVKKKLTREIDAQRRYHAAKDSGQPAKEVKRMRLEAESMCQAVTEYQLRSLGGATRALH